MVKMAESNPARLSERVAAVVSAARSYDLRQDQEAWSQLDELSSNTDIDGVEVDPAGIIFEDGDRFKGLLNVYVVLRYDADEEGDAFTTSDAFMGFFAGHFGPNETPVLDKVTVDTSTFYQ